MKKVANIILLTLLLLITGAAPVLAEPWIERMRVFLAKSVRKFVRKNAKKPVNTGF